MNKSPKKAKCKTAKELCSVRWNARAGENAWRSPDGTTVIWRYYDSTWVVWTENPLVGRRLSRLSNVRPYTQRVAGGYCEGFLVPWEKFKTCSVANALGPACDAPEGVPANPGANEASKVGLYGVFSEVGKAESESSTAGFAEVAK